jgi:dihydrofolate reductase
MSKLRVQSFGISLDGFGAGPRQDVDNPIGVGGMAIMEWFMQTRTWRQMHGEPGGTTDLDDAFAKRGFENLGAWILGRNMFGPVRGPWPDEQWKGWWGDTPPYHVPVFVLTHHPRQSIEMKGGTTFHFVTEGIHEALRRAKESAKEKDVRLGGGVATVRQYLKAQLVDEMHLAVRPILLGSGEHVLSGLNLAELGYTCSEFQSTPNAAHVVLKKK